MERNKIVVRFSDGRTLKGHANDFLPNTAEFHLETLEDEIPLINVADLKAVFFVKDHDGNADRQDSYDKVVAGAGRPNVADLKAVFCLKDHDGDADRQDSYDDVIAGAGRPMKVTFSDGEEMIGFVSSYSPDRTGFFLVPADRGNNNERVFVVTSSCKDVEFL